VSISGGAVGSTSTDVNGYFEFAGVADGTSTITVTAPTDSTMPGGAATENRDVEIVSATPALGVDFSTIPDVRQPHDVQPTVEIFMGDEWVDVSSPELRAGQAVNVRHGRTDWAAAMQAGAASFSLDTRDGALSPNNDTGPNFGNLKRNAPVRIAADIGLTHARHRGSTSPSAKDVVETPSTGALSISDVGDFRVAIDFESDLVDGVTNPIRLAKMFDGTNGFEWELYRSDESVEPYISAIRWYDGGVTESAAGFLPRSIIENEACLRALVNPTAGTVTFSYILDSIDLDATDSYVVPTFGTVTGLNTAVGIGLASTPLHVGGDNTDGTHIPVPGKIHGFQMRQGDNGAKLAALEPARWDRASTTFIDEAGRTWAVSADGEITSKQWRFHGELSSLPVRSTQSARDHVLNAEAGGLLRRLRQGDPVLGSPLRRGILRTPGISYYWPCEESGDQLTILGAAIGDEPLRIANGSVNTASYDGFASSSPIAEVGDGRWDAELVMANSAWQLRFSLYAPPDSTIVDGDIIYVQTVDNFGWSISYDSTGSGSLRLQRTNDIGAVLYDSGGVGFNANGNPMRIHLSVTPNGSDVDIDWQGRLENGFVGGITETAPNITIGEPAAIGVNPLGGATGLAIGHITMRNGTTDVSELENELSGFVGETAAARVRRLLDEEGITNRIVGDIDQSMPMGRQRARTLVQLLEECAATDLGYLYELRETVGLGYRTRTSARNQTATVSLDASASELSRPLDLDVDDNGLANDWTLRNESGAEARSVLDDGSDLSVSAPPVGAGRYETSATVNIAEEQDLPWLADRYRERGTVNEPRVSSLMVGLHRPRMPSGKLAPLLTARLGDRIDVNNYTAVVLGSAPSVQQVLQGTAETWAPKRFDVSLLTTSASPWSLAEPVLPSNEGGGPVTPSSFSYRWEDRSVYVEPDPTAAAGSAGKVKADELGITSRVVVTSKAELDAAVAAAVPGQQIYVSTTITVAAGARVLDVNGSTGGSGALNGALVVGAGSSPDGTVGAPIMVTCAPGAWLDGGLTPGNENANSRCAYLRGVGHWWLYGVNMRNSQFHVNYDQCPGQGADPIRVWYGVYEDAAHSAISFSGYFQSVDPATGSALSSGSGGKYGHTRHVSAKYNRVERCGVGNRAFGEAFYIGTGTSLSYTATQSHDIEIEANEIVECTAEALDAKIGCYNIRFVDNLIRDCSGDAPPANTSNVNWGLPGGVHLWPPFGSYDLPSGFNPNLYVARNRFVRCSATDQKFPSGFVLVCHRGTIVVGNYFEACSIPNTPMIRVYTESDHSFGDTGFIDIANNTSKVTDRALHDILISGDNPTELVNATNNRVSSDNVALASVEGAEFVVNGGDFGDDGTGYEGATAYPAAGGALDVAGVNTRAYWATDFAQVAVTAPVNPGCRQLAGV